MMLDVVLVRSFLESNGRIAIPLDTRQSQTPTTFHMGKGELGREKLGGGALCWIEFPTRELQRCRAWGWL